MNKISITQSLTLLYFLLMLVAWSGCSSTGSVEDSDSAPEGPFSGVVEDDSGSPKNEPLSGVVEMVGAGDGELYISFSPGDSVNKGVSGRPLAKKVSAEAESCIPEQDNLEVCITVDAQDPGDALFVRRCGSLFSVPAGFFDPNADPDATVSIWDLKVRGLVPGASYDVYAHMYNKETGEPVWCCSEARPLIDPVVLPGPENPDNSVHIDLISWCSGERWVDLNSTFHWCVLPSIDYELNGEEKWLSECKPIDIQVNLVGGTCPDELIELFVEVHELPDCSESELSIDSEITSIQYAPGCSIPEAGVPAELVSTVCTKINGIDFCGQGTHLDVWPWCE